MDASRPGGPPPVRHRSSCRRSGAAARRAGVTVGLHFPARRPLNEVLAALAAVTPGRRAGTGARPGRGGAA